jgi:hypothetical protein
MTEYLLGYAQARKAFSEHVVRRAEVPVEHMISLPMPTTRWGGVSGYAGFACPARRRPGEPLTLSAPDRWWALGARRGELLAYARTAALPFGTLPPAERVTLPPVTRPVAAILEDLRVLDEAMERAIGPFFDGEPGDATLRGDLREIVRAQVPAEIRPWYQALTPDFFTWLGL